MRNTTGARLKEWVRQNWKQCNPVFSFLDPLSWLELSFQFKVMHLGIAVWDIKLESARWLVYTNEYGWEPYSKFADRLDLRLHE